MLKVKCIQKFRDKNNVVIGYRIIDQNGNTTDISSKSLKQAIKQGRLEVINLTLTSDNRLIDKAIAQTPTQQTQKPIKQSHQEIIDIDKMLSRLKLLGCVIEIAEGCDHAIYLAKISEEDYRLIIPDDVTEIKFEYECNKPTPISKIPIESSNAKLKVYGGNNLEIAKELFAGVEFRTIDLTEFDTSKVIDMSGMFMECKATSLDLSSFNTRKVRNMSGMFMKCEATSIDLSSFDTSKVTNTLAMFMKCQATSLDLLNFDTSSIITMSFMFHNCTTTSINLGGNKDLESAWDKRWVYKGD